MEFDGLGLHYLKMLNDADALRSKWLWEAHTSDSLPWAQVGLAVSIEARVIFMHGLDLD